MANQSQSPPSPSPNEIIKMILFHLNECVYLIPNLLLSLLTKFDEVFPSETRQQWLTVVMSYVTSPVYLALILLVCYFCVPYLLGFIKWFFMLPWRMCRRVFRIIFGCCCCGCCCFCAGKRCSSSKMMKAPGKPGRYISRDVFESKPRSYFTNLHAKDPFLY